MPKTRFHQLLEARINEVIRNQTELLSDGSAHSYDEYKTSIGYIQGLRNALTLCDEIEKELD